MSDSIPTIIDRYVIQDVIGRGAMGVILRAYDPALDRTLAIKLVSHDLLNGARGLEYTSRFQREARAASRCPHPNIVTVYDYGVLNGRPYLVMEFIDGVSLHSAMANGKRFSKAEAIWIIGQVLDALECAHSAGIVHRDVKPANILLSPDLRTKLADFGIARVDGSDLTSVGDMIGTPSYMSPEQCLGHHVDGRSDLFSVGTVLYEVLTGQKAFSGSMTAIIRGIIDGNPDLSLVSAAADHTEITSVLCRALLKDPAARFQSAAVMAQALRYGGQLISNLDATLIMRPALAHGTTPEATHFDVTTLVGLERQLATFVGPVASVILRRAALQATTLEELLDAVGNGIDHIGERNRFLHNAKVTLREPRAHTTSSTQSSASAPRVATLMESKPIPLSVNEMTLEAVRFALMPYTGPIAAILVKRAAAGCADLDNVWRIVAQHIENDFERSYFLEKRPR